MNRGKARFRVGLALSCAAMYSVAIGGCGVLIGIDEYVPSTCSDGVKGGAESDVDCGSECGACASGKACRSARDCLSGMCTAGVCAEATCSDGIKNGVESDVDCGGGICAPCANQQSCGVAEDCVSLGCDSGACGAWAMRWGGAGLDSASEVVVDVKGEVIVYGSFSGTVDFGGGPLTSQGDPDIYVAKFSHKGEYRWSKRFGGPNADFALSMVTDSAGDIVLSANGSAVDFGDGKPKGMKSGMFGDLLIAKLAGANGGHIWSYALPTGTLTGSGLAIDKMGNTFLGGSFTTSLMFGIESVSSVGASDAFVVKLAPSNGAPLWMKSFGGNSHERINGLAVDGDGDVVAVGESSSAVVDFGGGPRPGKEEDFVGGDLFLLKLSGSTGTHVWSEMFGAIGADDGNYVAIDATGNVIVTGGIADATDLGEGSIGGMGMDALVAKFDGTTGEHLWSRAWGGLLTDSGAQVALEPGGDVLVIGRFQSSTADFGGGSLSNPSAPEDGAFLARYSTNDGSHLFSAVYGSPDGLNIAGIAIDPLTANVLLAGSFSGGAKWGSSSLASSGGTDIFLASLGPIP